jgi:hypothetical protein
VAVPGIGRRKRDIAQDSIDRQVIGAGDAVLPFRHEDERRLRPSEQRRSRRDIYRIGIDVRCVRRDFDAFERHEGAFELAPSSVALAAFKLIEFSVTFTRPPSLI